MDLGEALHVVEDFIEGLKENTLKNIKELREGEMAEFSISGWVKRNGDGYRVGIWRGYAKVNGIDEYVEMVDENREFLELYAKSLTPSKVKILLLAYDGISEGELSQRTGLRGGALHYHLRDLLLLGLLEKRGRGKYYTTKYGSFVIRSAISAIRKFKESVREVD